MKVIRKVIMEIVRAVDGSKKVVCDLVLISYRTRAVSETSFCGSHELPAVQLSNQPLGPAVQRVPRSSCPISPAVQLSSESRGPAVQRVPRSSSPISPAVRLSNQSRGPAV